jgi:hypothetical protein
MRPWHPLRLTVSYSFLQNITQDIYMLEIYEAWEGDPEPWHMGINVHDQRVNGIALQISGKFRRGKFPALSRRRADGEQQSGVRAALFTHNCKQRVRALYKSAAQPS